MEDLLTPQICMDVDETPLDVGNIATAADDDSSSEAGEPVLDDDEKVKLLLEETFTDSSQVPEELTEFENDAKRNVFAAGEPAVQFQRLHCTACNVHLGSAPTGHFSRYIHPLLKVLLCKTCYEFYCSGEFDKDEDGSEMYCRWCGQGGKVMCCAQCAFVFCQKCVRQNLGKRTLELIKDSDDWLCFSCNPTQLINLKIICTSLFEFVQEEIRLAKSLNNIERLKADHTVCCQKVRAAAKRKRDEDYNPQKWDDQVKFKRPSLIKSTPKPVAITENNTTAKTWNQKEEAEVVCTPDLMSLMEDDAPQLTSMPKLVQMNNFATSTNSILGKELSKAPATIVKEPILIQPKAVRTDGKKLYTIAPKTPNMIMATNNIQRAAPNFVRLQSPAIKFIPTVSRAPVMNSIPAQITPGTKHEWYDKAATVVSTITGSLSTTLTNLSKEQRNAKTVEQLANIHNKLQELLSSSVNSLIQVRKNLRSEFLADLNKLKFSNAPTYVSRPSIMKARPQNTSNKENDDDDVIIINSDCSSTNSIITEPPPLVKLIPKEIKPINRPYLKVRSVSQLLSVSSECITIPDDPPSQNDDVIPVEEKDPLAFEASENTDAKKSSPSLPTPVPSNCNEIDTIKMRNGRTESSIEKLVIENMKYSVEDIAEDELKRILAVRVLLASDFSVTLPENRLKTASWFVDTDVENTSGPKDNEILNTETESNIIPPILFIENEETGTSEKNKENNESEPMDIDATPNESVEKITKVVEPIEVDDVDEDDKEIKQTDGVEEKNTGTVCEKDENKGKESIQENTDTVTEKDEEEKRKKSIEENVDTVTENEEKRKKSIEENTDTVTEKDEEEKESIEENVDTVNEKDEEKDSIEENADIGNEEDKKESDIKSVEENANVGSEKDEKENADIDSEKDEENDNKSLEGNADIVSEKDGLEEEDTPNMTNTNEEDANLDDEEGNSNEVETNSNKDVSMNEADTSSTEEKKSNNVTKTSDLSEIESDINSGNNGNV